jgi:hypothetical protein
VVAATSPITFAAGTVAFDQSANNTTNDTRYARLGATNTFSANQTISGSLSVNPGSNGVINLGDSSFSKGPGNGFIFNSGIATVSYLGVGVNGGSGSVPLFVTLGSATAKTVVRGAASQSANLQEWQNSAGSSLASITSNGGIFANFLGASGGQFQLSYTTGGTLRLTRNTALPNKPGANPGVLYFRDGTNAGTLKLCVSAGTAGAEQTLLDNIPQT